VEDESLPSPPLPPPQQAAAVVVVDRAEEVLPIVVVNAVVVGVAGAVISVLNPTVWVAQAGVMVSVVDCPIKIVMVR